MNLYFRKMGQGFPLIILHGLYGSSDNWLSIARGLSERFQVIVPDLRNHGRSPHDPEHTYPAMCADVLELMDDNTIGQCVLLGHSMGGKTAMHVAHATPQRVSRLIIDDIAPVNYSSLTGYSPLSVEHLNIADSLLHTDLTQFARREDVEQAWAGSIPDMDIRRFLLKNIQREGGHFAWRINIRALAENLPQILNGMDTIGLDKGQRIEIPTMFVKGERSPYIQPEMYPLIHQAFPKSTIATIPQAGHWLHVEQPEMFLKEVVRFLQIPGE